MKKNCFLALAWLPVFAFAQSEADLSRFLQASQADARALLEGYTSPVFRGLSYGMTGGWYHTAKAHKPLGIDFGVTINATFLPASENYFEPSLTNGTFINNTNPGKGAPTLVGPGDDTQYSVTYDPDGNGPLTTQTFTFAGPEGLNLKESIGLSAVPAPMIQLGVGLFKNTDLKVRYVPKVQAGNSDFQMLGFGLMHDIKQYLPGIKVLPFDLSALVAYNRISGSTTLINTDPNDSRPDSADGLASYSFNSWVVQGLISKQIKIITLYAGAGYGFVSSRADVKGTFTLRSDSDVAFDIVDPVNLEFDNKSLRLTAGVRFKFGPVYLCGDYTVQKYNNLAVGFGFTFR